MFIILHDMGGANRLSVEHKIREAGKHDNLCVDVAPLIVQVVVLRALQKQSDPLHSGVKDRLQMLVHPFSDFLSLFQIFKQSLKMIFTHIIISKIRFITNIKLCYYN